jgi:hypothetical protein
MAEAQMKKAALLEDQNMLLLMTMPEDKITTAEAREYLRLRRGDELKKLRRKLAAEEERERVEAACAADEVARSSATKRRRCRQLGSGFEEGEGSQPGFGGYSEGFDLGDTAAAAEFGEYPAAGSQQEGVGSQGACSNQGDGDGVGDGEDECAISLGQVAARERRPAASLGGRSAMDFGYGAAPTVGATSTQGGNTDFERTVGADTELNSGAVTDSQTRRVNSHMVGGFNRGWLGMDRVDPCQPTQAYNLGSHIMQDSNMNWTGEHSGRMQGNRVDLESYVEPGANNVDVGLSLQGQFY